MEDWVRQKKAEAARRKLVNNTPSFLSGMMYTGSGVDGQPAGMMESGGMPFLVHKNEMVQNTPEGAFVMNGKTARRAYPSFAAGGFLSTIKNRLKGVADTISNNVADAAQKSVTDNGITTDQTAPVETQNQQNYKQPYVESGMVKPTQNTGVINPVDYTSVTDQNGTTTDQTLPETLNPQNYKQPYVDSGAVPGQSNVESQLIFTDRAKAYANAGVPATQPTVEPTTTPDETTPPASQEDSARTVGLDYLAGSLNGTTGSQIAAKQNLDNLARRQQQERSAKAQQLAQQGITGSQAEVEMQMLRNQQESELNAAAADYQASINAEKVGIAGTLASQGLAGQQFEEGKKQYGDTKAWQDFEYATQYGSDADVIAAYKSATGKDLDPASVAEIRGYARTKRAQDVASGNISITAGQISNEASRLGVDSARLNSFITAVNNGSDLATANSISGLNLTADQYNGIRSTYAVNQTALKNSLGDAQWNSIQTMINQGASLSQVNDRLASNGQKPITQAEYTSMLDSTALGERNWGRKLAAANMLLANPGTADQAAQVYEDIFPGVDFDFTKLKDTQKSEAFASGLSELAGYVTAGMDQKIAVAALKASGSLDLMGLSDMDAAQLYDSMQVNALDEEWNVVEESALYKGLNDQEKADMREFFEAKLLGKLDYTTMHEYEVTDKNGVVTTIYGKDSTEADKAAAKNGGTVKDTGRVQYQLASTINTTGTTTSGEPSYNEALGRFNESQSNIPDDKKVSPDDFKVAWVKAGKPSTYTYDDYMKDRESETPNYLTSLVDKYKDGWPSDILTRGNRESTPYIPSQGNETFINAAKAARGAFLATPENTVTISKDNVFSGLEDYERSNNLSIAPSIGTLTEIKDVDVVKNKPIVIEGYDTPFMFLGYTMGPNGDKKSYMLVSLSDGKIQTFSK